MRQRAGRDLSLNERRRLECVQLLGRGLTVSQVADLLECNPVTVRAAVQVGLRAHYTWSCIRQRAVVPREDTRGRRGQRAGRPGRGHLS
ncbi:helix-turn-helix domain-containing protein [Nonomuraea sp. NPDC049152]|uniref:helix-turn-helix domain-containing protein n=1 Tax=Nonomuraea sp. NPDC049152 TaxID=3154350 RepID=UPI0033CCC372